MCWATENLTEEIQNTDILIVSTEANEPTVLKEQLSKDQKIVIIDLSMPENVEVSIKEELRQMLH